MRALVLWASTVFNAIFISLAIDLSDNPSLRLLRKTSRLFSERSFTAPSTILEISSVSRCPKSGSRRIENVSSSLMSGLLVLMKSMHLLCTEESIYDLMDLFTLIICLFVHKCMKRSFTTSSISYLLFKIRAA